MGLEANAYNLATSNALVCSSPTPLVSRQLWLGWERDEWTRAFVYSEFRMKPSLRFAVLERDGFRCVYCGASASNGLHVDHLDPSSKGGEDDFYNFVTACQDCNLGKSNHELGGHARIAIDDAVHTSNVQRSLELLRHMADVVSAVAPDDLRSFASDLPSPFWPRNGEWLGFVQYELDQYVKRSTANVISFESSK